MGRTVVLWTGVFVLAATAGGVLISRTALSNGKASTEITPRTGNEHERLWTCGMHPRVVQDHPGNCPICHMKLTPMRQDPSTGSGQAPSAGPAVRIDPTVVQNTGVRTATVTRGPLKKTVRTLGMLKLPETGLHDVSLKVGGWIDKLYADQMGMHVVKGAHCSSCIAPTFRWPSRS